MSHAISGIASARDDLKMAKFPQLHYMVLLIMASTMPARIPKTQKNETGIRVYSFGSRGGWVLWLQAEASESTPPDAVPRVG